jgi:hypothetical protein
MRSRRLPSGAVISSGSRRTRARTLGPDIVGANFTGWWVYVFGDFIGAAITVVIIILVRGLPAKAEREAAEGGALPLRRSLPPRERSLLRARARRHGRRGAPDCRRGRGARQQ